MESIKILMVAQRTLEKVLMMALGPGRRKAAAGHFCSSHPIKLFKCTTMLLLLLLLFVPVLLFIVVK